MKFRLLTMCALAALTVSPTIADEEAKKANRNKRQTGRQNVAAVLMKQLGDVGLTEEQKTKITEMGKKIAAEMKTIREEVDLTSELQKKLAEAQKSMRESEKKGRERLAAVYESAGLNEAQTAAIKKVNEVRTKFQKEVFGMLTDEQKAKLPERMSKAMNRGAESRKGKKKKKESA